MRRKGDRQELVFERIVNEAQVRGSCMKTQGGRHGGISKEIPNFASITSINDVKILFSGG